MTVEESDTTHVRGMRENLGSVESNADEFTFRLVGVTVVAHVAGLEGEEGVVAAHANVFAGPPECTTLTVKNHAGTDFFACLFL